MAPKKRKAAEAELYGDDEPPTSLAKRTAHFSIMERIVNDVNEHFPCRSDVVAELAAHFLDPFSPCPPLLITGPTATGKTALTLELARRRSLLCAGAAFGYVSCVEAYTPALLFEGLLRGLSTPDQEYAPCVTFAAFVRALNSLPGLVDGSSILLIVDDVDRLASASSATLISLLRLPELLVPSITLVLITAVPWERLRPKDGCVEPLVVSVPAYELEDLKEIVARDASCEEEKVHFERLTKIVTEALQPTCRNLNEVRHLTLLLFPTYMKPVLAASHQGGVGGGSVHTAASLFANVSPVVTRALESVYLRTLSRNELDGSAALPARGSVAALELPRLSKYLLIASFYGSYNPARLDGRYFTPDTATGLRKRGGTRRQRATAVVHNPQVNGPASFTLERLLAILHGMLAVHTSSVVGEDRVTAEMLHQISTLVSLNLLERVSSLAGSSVLTPKYRCNVSFDMAKSLAASVGMSIHQFLHVE